MDPMGIQTSIDFEVPRDSQEWLEPFQSEEMHVMALSKLAF